MTEILQNLNWTVLIGIMGGICSFTWSIYRYLDSKNREQNIKEFEHFHELIKNLVQPDPEIGKLFLDRQAAIIFELRHFKRYYPYSLRMLKNLLLIWENHPNSSTWLMDEINLTIQFLEKEIKEK